MTRQITRTQWTPEQDTLLRELYPHMRITELCRMLSSKTRAAIYNRAEKLGIKKETFEQEEFVGDRPTPTGYRADRDGITTHRMR